MHTQDVLTGVLFGMFLCLLIGLLGVEACSSPHAQATSRPDLTCQDISIGDTGGQRCENAEVICYMYSAQALSCIRKSP